MKNSLYENCNLCPRNCGVNRFEKTGFCGETSEIKIACGTLHFGEEPPVTALGGSGTIFLTGCNLRCAFCQNYQISQKGMGKTLSVDEFADLCLTLESNGAENVNLVTGSHHIPAIAEGLERAKVKGLKIPVCWNSSAYENIEALELLDGLVDIWLPDMKTLNPMISDEVFKAKDYPKVAKKAIRWMMEHSTLKFETIAEKNDKDSVKRHGSSQIEKMISGVIIRHLVLPGRIDDTRLVLDWLKNHADGKACISLMSQYTPVEVSEKDFSKEEIAGREKSLQSFQHRLMNQNEFDEIRNLIDEYNFEYLFYQELTSDTDWLPDFNNFQPFSNELSKTIWHWSLQNLAKEI